MVAIAIFSADPVRRRSLDEALRRDPAVTIVGLADEPAAVARLIEQNHVDAVVADAPPPEQLSDWRNRYDRPAVVVLVDVDGDGLEATASGAVASLPRTAQA